MERGNQAVGEQERVRREKNGNRTRGREKEGDVREKEDTERIRGERMGKLGTERKGDGEREGGGGQLGNRER